MSNEITRVARAIAERALVSSRHPWPAPNHPDWIDLACAAIDAMTSRHRPGEIEQRADSGLAAEILARRAQRLHVRKPSQGEPNE